MFLGRECSHLSARVQARAPRSRILGLLSEKGRRPLTARVHLCLIDGTYELFRAYFGAPSRTAQGGLEVGAVVALARSFRRLALEGSFTHFAVAFDTRIESFRNDLFAGYKTGEGIESDLLGQFSLAEEATAAMGMRVLSMIEFEADDGLATAAARFALDQEVERIVIASPDKDLMQCVGGKVSTWDRMRDKHYDRASVIEKMGVAPELVPDYLALVGDSADGIPGVPRWGARSAAAVLSRYGALEGIPRDASAWDIKVRGAAALSLSLREHEPEVLLYRTLATLRTDAPFSHSLEDLRYAGVDALCLENLSKRLGVNLGP